jgi:hypothetical protein
MRLINDGTLFPSGCRGSVRDIAVTWHTERLSLPELGEASSSWRAVARHTAESGPADLPLVSDIELDFQVFRRGNLIALIVMIRDAPRDEGSDFLDKIALQAISDFGTRVDERLFAIKDSVPDG